MYLKNRNDYMKILLEFKDKNVIKIITGIRRCGKSMLLELFANKLTELGVNKKNIIKINFESHEYDSIYDYNDLYKFIKNKIKSKQKTYLIFDEIQNVQNWQKAINSFMVDFNADIYITGSNAYMLSSELSTFLSGRYVEIKMLPLSFKEFLDFNTFDNKTTTDEKFQMYLQYGSMPAVFEYDFNMDRINGMLEGIYNTVILKDVSERNKITDISLLKKIVNFLAGNIGNITSVNNITNYLINGKRIDKNSKKNSVANKTVDNYISFLENAFIFYSADRYDIKGKEHLKTLKKYYIVDTGIRNMLLGLKDTDRGHILENVVYLELLRRGYKVSIGKIKNNEIDFIAESPSEKIYYQVCEQMPDQSVRNRELEPLKMTDDNYKKVLLSMDKNFITSFDGIENKNITDFLLE